MLLYASRYALPGAPLMRYDQVIQMATLIERNWRACHFTPFPGQVTLEVSREHFAELLADMPIDPYMRRAEAMSFSSITVMGFFTVMPERKPPQRFYENW